MFNKKKKLVAILLGMIFLLQPLNLVFAGENSKIDKEQGISVQAPDYNTAEYQRFIKDNIDHVNEVINSILRPRSSFQKRLDVPLYKQENGYYCGPAVLQMILAYKGQSYSQDTLASYAGTNDGTYVYRMRNTLNQILGDVYVYVNISDQMFKDGLYYSIDNDYPVVCHVMTGALEVYRRKNVNVSHYVVATGYVYGFSGNQSGEFVYYNDPHYKSAFFGRYRDTVANMSQAIANHSGFFIRGK